MIKIRPLIIHAAPWVLERLEREYGHYQGMDCRLTNGTLIVRPKANRANLGGMK